MRDGEQPRSEGDVPPAGSAKCWGFPQGRRLADPRVTYMGPVAAWWIPKPRGPRVSLRFAAIAWFAAMLVMTATVLFLEAGSKPLWPFGRRISSVAEIGMRYELILLVCLGYVTLLSLPAWIRHRRWARADASAIHGAIQAEQWEKAGLLVHRYCLLVSAIWRRVPARVDAWDGILSRRLPLHRRLYVYYRNNRPVVPADSSASFVPAVFSCPQPSLWSAVGLIPVAFLLYTLLADIVRHGYWQRAILFNAVLLLILLVAYGTYFLMGLLGRSNYFRFAPGVVQLVKFVIRRQRPVIESFDLRGVDAVLDLSWGSPGLTLLNPPGYRRITFRLPKKAEVIEAVLRALLSTAPRPPLSEDQLVE